MIRLVSRIFGLKPYYSHRIQYNANQNIQNPSEQYNYGNRDRVYDQYYDNNDLQFYLTPEDLQARSRRSLQILINWFTSLGLKLIEYFKL